MYNISYGVYSSFVKILSLTIDVDTEYCGRNFDSKVFWKTEGTLKIFVDATVPFVLDI